MNWGGHRHLALLSPSAEERYLVSLQSSFNCWFYPPNSSSSYQTLRTLTSTTRLFHNKTAVKRIELLGGWVLPHGRKRIFTIIRLPWKLEWCQGEDTVSSHYPIRHNHHLFQHRSPRSFRHTIKGYASHYTTTYLSWTRTTITSTCSLLLYSISQ